MTDLDRLLKQIADEPAPADLTTVEAEVWARIDQDPARPVWARTGAGGSAAVLRLPALAVLSALLIGAAVGAATLQGRSPDGPMSAFSVAAPYAPSTLLGGASR